MVKRMLHGFEIKAATCMFQMPLPDIFAFNIKTNYQVCNSRISNYILKELGTHVSFE